MNSQVQHGDMRSEIRRGADMGTRLLEGGDDGPVCADGPWEGQLGWETIDASRGKPRDDPVCHDCLMQ